MLGERRRLITRGGLVSPADHLVVAGVVAVTQQPAVRIVLTASVHEAQMASTISLPSA